MGSWIDTYFEEAFWSWGSDRKPEQNAQIGDDLVLAWSGVRKSKVDEAVSLKYAESIKKLPVTLNMWWDSTRNQIRVRSPNQVLTELIRGTRWFEGMDEIVIVAIVLNVMVSEP